MNRIQVFLVVLFISPAFYNTGSAQEFKDLKGKWVCTTDYGSIQLEFVSGNVLIYDGESVNYQIIGQTIRVSDSYGIYDYPYKLVNQTLSISFPEGYTLIFMRSANQDSGTEKPNIQTDNSPTTPASGQEHLLSGKLCHWSGSSSYSSSYSSSTWVFFDGKGGFTYGSETSFSSDAGMAYGQDPGGGNTGKYTVKGNQVYLNFSDGSSGIAEVYFRQNDGRITELTYNGNHYGTGLCE